MEQSIVCGVFEDGGSREWDVLLLVIGLEMVASLVVMVEVDRFEKCYYRWVFVLAIAYWFS